MMRLALFVLCATAAGCDSSADTEPPVALGATAAGLDWESVRLHTGGQETELFWGLIRELDMRRSGDSGELVLFWGADGAIVSRNGAVRIESFWPPDEPGSQAVTPELWKSLVRFISDHSDGRYQGKGAPALAFQDGRGEASDTEWTLTAASGTNGEPVLLVKWSTRWKPTFPGAESGGP